MQNGTPHNPDDTFNSDWRGAALCRRLSPEEADEIFFIGPGKSSKRAQVFCSSCPVKKECSTFAIVHNEKGIWAGATEDDREALDPFIKNIALEQWLSEGNRLESRNINDFIQQQHHQLTALNAQALLDHARLALDEAELLVQQLMAPSHPFDNPSVPRAIGQ